MDLILIGIFLLIFALFIINYIPTFLWLWAVKKQKQGKKWKITKWIGLGWTILSLICIVEYTGIPSAILLIILALPTILAIWAWAKNKPGKIWEYVRFGGFFWGAYWIWIMLKSLLQLFS